MVVTEENEWGGYVCKERAFYIELNIDSLAFPA
jgi:hypothetical protein